jgi:hypothetical protein
MYPLIGLEDTGHHKIAWACGQGKHHLDQGLLTSACKSIAEDASRTNTNVILSSEEFEYVNDVEPLRILKDYFNVKVVLYVRKQDHYLESKYNQHVRAYDLRYSGSIYQFLPKFNFFSQFNYKALAERWEKVFGLDSIIVRPYGTSMVDPDVREDLLSVAGALPKPVGDDYQNDPSSNISLSATSIPYLSYVNQMHLTHSQHQALITLLDKSVPADRNARLLHSDDSRQFYEKFNPSNRLFFSRYLGIDSIPFDELVLADMKKTWVNHEQVDVRKLLSFIDQILSKN